MQQEIFKSQIEASRLKNDEYILLQSRKNLLIKLSQLSKIELNENTVISFRKFDADYLINTSSFELTEKDVNSLTDNAFNSRSDLRALKNKITSANTNLEISRLSRYPDFNVKFGYKILPFEKHNAFNIMLGMTLPFAPWSSGKYDDKIQNSEIGIKAAESEYEAKRTEIYSEIKTAVNELETARNVLQFYQNILIPQTENSMKSAESSYETNMSTFMDVLDAFRMYQEAKGMFYEAMGNYLKTTAELEKAAGLNNFPLLRKTFLLLP